MRVPSPVPRDEARFAYFTRAFHSPIAAGRWPRVVPTASGNNLGGEAEREQTTNGVVDVPATSHKPGKPVTAKIAGGRSRWSWCSVTCGGAHSGARRAQLRQPRPFPWRGGSTSGVTPQVTAAICHHPGRRCHPQATAALPRVRALHARARCLGLPPTDPGAATPVLLKAKVFLRPTQWRGYVQAGQREGSGDAPGRAGAGPGGKRKEKGT